MLNGNGNASFRVPQPNCVSALMMFGSLVFSYFGRFYSASQEDEMGQLYLSNVDFLKCGVPASIIAALVSDSLHECDPKLTASSTVLDIGCFDCWIFTYASDRVSHISVCRYRVDPVLKLKFSCLCSGFNKGRLSGSIHTCTPHLHSIHLKPIYSPTVLQYRYTNTFIQGRSK